MILWNIYNYTLITQFLIAESKKHPLGIGSNLNTHKTFRRCPGRLLNVLCTFNLRPVSRGYKMSTVADSSIISIIKAYGTCNLARALHLERVNGFHVFYYRSSHRRCSIKKVGLKNFVNFIGKHPCWSLLLIKLRTKTRARTRTRTRTRWALCSNRPANVYVSVKRMEVVERT